MFKVYSHISSLIQELYYLNSLNPINLKKKRYFSKPRARAKIQEYTFASQQYSPFPPAHNPHTVPFFVLLYPALGFAHFYHNPFVLAPTPRFTRPTSLADSLFFYSS
jgi:hypothetical protein